MPSTTVGYAASAVTQLPTWLAANLVAFDERYPDPLVNRGTLGAAGDATATGTQRLAFNGIRYACFPQSGSNVNELHFPDPPQIGGATEFDVRIAVALDDYTPAANNYLVVQGAGGATGAFRFMVLSGTGRMYLDAGDGVAQRTILTSGGTGLADGSINVLRFDWRGSDGRTRFFYKPTTEANAASDMANNSGWTQVEGDKTLSSVTALLNQAVRVDIGTSAFFGKFYALQMATTIDGAPFFSTSIHNDNVSSTATSYTATTGQTVTIQRATGATRKLAVVTRAVRLFDGASDFLTVADNAALNFDQGQSFTPWALYTRWATISNFAVIVAKKASNGTSQGWTLHDESSVSRFAPSDGVAYPYANGGTGVSGLQVLHAGVRDVVADQNKCYRSDVGFGTAVTDTSTLTYGNSLPVTVGKFGTTGSYGAFELLAWGIYPGALTATQLLMLRDALLVPEAA